MNDVAAIARLLGEPARATMVECLMDGTERPSGELARYARIAPATASEHLGRLVAAGLLATRTQGRHRYYRIAREDVAHAIETLAALAPAPRVRSLSHGNLLAQQRAARTCYGHLAGVLGVTIHDALVARAWIAVDDDGRYTLTGIGRRGLRAAGVALDELPQGRAVVRPCLDVTERRPHLGGSAACALAARVRDAGWIVDGGVPRAVRVTPAGREAFFSALGVRT